MAKSKSSAPTVLLTSTTGSLGIVLTRTLAQAGYCVLSASDNHFPLGLRSRFASEHYDLPARSFPEYEAALLDLIEKRRPDVVLPLGTHCVAAIAQHHDRVARVSAINVPTWDNFRLAYDKVACAEYCDSLGIPTPRRLSVSEAEAFLASGGGQRSVVIKPSFEIGSSTGMRLVQRKEDLHAQIALTRAHHRAAMLQEYIPGGQDQMHSISLLFSQSSELLAAFTIQKLRQFPPTGGVSVAAISNSNPALLEQVLPFFRSLNWRGPAEVELKWDAREQRYYWIEINPRFAGYVGFARRCGLNLGVLAVQAAQGIALAPLPYPAYRSGERHLIFGLFLQTLLSELRQSGIAREPLHRAWRHFSGATFDALEHLHDPAAMLGRKLLAFQRRISSAAPDNAWKRIPIDFA